MIMILNAIHDPVHQKQTQASGPARLQRGLGIDCRRCADIEVIDVKVLQPYDDFLFLLFNLQTDICYSPLVVFNQVGEDFFNSQLHGIDGLLINLQRHQKRIQVPEYPFQR